jgi:chorismate mutase
MPVPCNSIEEIRAQIDQLDRQIVVILIERETGKRFLITTIKLDHRNRDQRRL